ncbi:alpha/beta hydrolase [Pacificimonas sp. ICDLI1SI03]
MAAAQPVRDDPPHLAEGIARYVELFRAQPAAADLSGIRLNGDLMASRFDGQHKRHVRRFNTAISLPGREVPVRVFDPGGQSQRPAICYFHGGGFALGSIESFDIVAAELAHAACAIVVSVEYRRLPENTYSAAQADCDEAFAWVCRNAGLLGADSDALFLAGDSVGALFALVSAANARDADGQKAPSALLLFYGAFAMDGGDPAYRGALDPLLTPDRIENYTRLFRECGGPDGGPAPVDRSDLSGLPPIHIVAAEHDPLLHDARRLEQKLAAASVPVTFRIAPGMIHGFLRAAGVSPAVREEVRLAVQTIPALTSQMSA